MDTIPKGQDVPTEYIYNSLPSITVFISHRWESKEHPDPQSNQKK